MPRCLYNPQLPRRERIDDFDEPDSHMSSASCDTDDLPIRSLPCEYDDKPTNFDIGSDIAPPSIEVPVSDAGVVFIDNLIRAYGKQYVSDEGESDVEMTEPVEAEEEDFNALPQCSVEEEEDQYYLGAFSDVDPEEQTPIQPPLPSSSIPPASSSGTTFSADPTSAMPHHSKRFTMCPFTAALALYCVKWNVSREQYSDLLSILKTIENIPPEISSLPTRVDTIKETLDKQLPLLTFRSRKLHLDQSLLPTRASCQEEMVVFDMSDFFKHLLQAEDIMSRAHVGLAHYVDEPTEFWHSQSWGGSNRTTSGRFARIKSGRHKDDIVLASDFIWWQDTKTTKTRVGRVTFVGIDMTNAAKENGTYGKVKLSIQPTWSYSQLDKALQKNVDAVGRIVPHTESHVEDLFLVENEEEVRITEDDIRKQEISVHLDYYHKTSTPSKPALGRFHIRYIVSHKPVTMRPLALSHPHRGELEIKTYGRDTFTKNLNASTKSVRSLPYTLFIDAFGLYRNMYRPIPGFYAQFAFMNQLDRKRQINVFPITLAPFAAKWEDVVHSLMHLKELETGVEIKLDNGSKVTLCAPCLAYVGDMPQQQGNAGCKNQKAEHYCRSCLISSKDDYQKNLTFDIVAQGRYHYETERIREEAKQWHRKMRDQTFQKLGLNDEPSPLAAIHESLCVPVAFPGDVAHSEFCKGLRKGCRCLVNKIVFDGEATLCLR
jgi:hypothetical protein